MGDILQETQEGEAGEDLEELDKLHDFCLGLVTASDILEHDLIFVLLVHRIHLCLANIENATAATGSAHARPTHTRAAAQLPAREPHVASNQQQSGRQSQQLLQFRDQTCQAQGIIQRDKFSRTGLPPGK